MMEFDKMQGENPMFDNPEYEDEFTDKVTAEMYKPLTSTTSFGKMQSYSSKYLDVSNRTASDSTTSNRILETQDTCQFMDTQQTMMTEEEEGQDLLMATQLNCHNFYNPRKDNEYSDFAHTINETDVYILSR